MKLTSEHYYRAALERMAQARALYDRGDSYALSMYISGAAVECLLRAFKLRRDPTFDERHDVLRLFRASGMLDINPARLQAKGFSETEEDSYARILQATVTEVSILWSNDYRYASEERLRTHLKRNVALRVKVKGDVLKAVALRLLNAAQRFMEKGMLLWKLS